MVTHVSFSATIRAYLRGLLTDTDLDTAKFAFQVMREHALAPLGQVPYEDSWENLILQPLFSDKANRLGHINLDQLDERLKIPAGYFLASLKVADSEGRVRWGHKAPAAALLETIPGAVWPLTKRKAAANKTLQ